MKNMIRAKKHLGQNFLWHKGTLTKIRDELDITPNEIVVEIGPGTGNLTAELVGFPIKLICIEKDPDMISILNERFKEAISRGRMEILERDVLGFDFSVLGEYKLPYKIVGNIPYYITGAIIRHALEANPLPEQVVFLVQKEVADRAVARDGKESLLSLSIKAFGKPRSKGKVPAKFFKPAPKVDSAVLSIEGISRNNFENKDHEALFFEIIRHAFAHKRKTALKNLSSYLHTPDIRSWWQELSLDEKIRAEDIPIETWIKLSRFVYNGSHES
jgi:16S rRNA (adenine1518-N6/adenine1519-N6)-dimethyltransferase